MKHNYKKQLKTVTRLQGSDLCPVCRKDWKDCSHSHTDVDNLVFNLRVKVAMGA